MADNLTTAVVIVAIVLLILCVCQCAGSYGGLGESIKNIGEGIKNIGEEGIKNIGEGIKNIGDEGIKNIGEEGFRSHGGTTAGMGYSRNTMNCPYAYDGDIPARLANENYSKAIQDMSLEPDVQRSHDEWLNGLAHRTTTASTDTVRDDTNNINPVWGLTGIMRQNIQYRTRAQPLAGSRVIPTDIPCDMGGPIGSLNFYGKKCLI